MHSCLCIDEILQNMFGHVDDTPTLGSLSLVCRAFHEPANDTLWADLPGLAPLVKCLPDELVATPDKSYRTVTILRPPQRAEWQRFQYHAQRVIYLTVASDEEDEFAVDQGALRILAHHYPAPFFPRLVHFEWHNWHLAEFASLFIEPSVCILKYIPAEVEPMRTVLARVRTHAPRLQKLEFIDGIYDTLDKLHNEFSQAILSMNDLTVLEVQYASLQRDALLHVSRLPHLTTLSLYLTTEIDSSWHSSYWGRFPALRRLFILPEEDRTSIASCASFLNALSERPKLSYLELRPSPTLHHNDFEDLMSAIGRFERLSYLSITFNNSRGEWGGLSIQGSTLSPLQQLSCLQNFTLSGCPVSFESDAVQGLAAAWTCLEYLILTSASTDLCHFRMEDLSFFSQHCPNLRSLTVQVHAVGDDWAHRGTIRAPMRSLRYLQLYAISISPAAEPAVALFLAKSFPMVTISSHHPIVRYRRQLAAHEVAAMETIERLNAETQRWTTGVVLHVLDLEDRAVASQKSDHAEEQLSDN
ncbi:F-box protein [Phanerochaete sordida]|uniref:F-box protein n=1 Tax=Phanerochaete sordida TaxID=48140 RepID=A0A9P3LKN3_9APHY|nr:F-box protein [Phanerochaete sordida]